MTEGRATISSTATSGSVRVLRADLGAGVGAWFTGRGRSEVEPSLGADGNLSHRRPHQPARLAADRRDAFAQMGLDPADVVWMRQVHGPSVGTVTADTPRGAELRDVDALVTAERGRPLAVQVADCVPVLLASPEAVGVAHAGRRGVQTGVVPATVARLRALGAGQLRAVIGPAIGGCCYEVPEELQAEVADDHPEAVARTTWRTPSLDLPGAVAAQLASAGVDEVTRVGGCTRCDPEERFFSHRRDPETGRQVGIVVRTGGVA